MHPVPFKPLTYPPCKPTRLILILSPPVSLEPTRPVHRHARPLHPARPALGRPSRAPEEARRHERAQARERQGRQQGRLGGRGGQAHGRHREGQGDHLGAAQSESVHPRVVRNPTLSLVFYCWFVLMGWMMDSLWHELRVVLHNRESTLLTQIVQSFASEEREYADAVAANWASLVQGVEGMPFE